MAARKWILLGEAADFKKRELQSVEVDSNSIALSYRDGHFGAISGSCLHVGGPLGEGAIKDDYVVCPWHSWQFHRITGQGQPGYPDAVAQYELKQEDGKLYVNINPLTQGKRSVHPKHALERSLEREPGPLRIAGISTTIMNKAFPRYSTSEALLETALDHASSKVSAQTRLIRLNDIKFRACERYYSKSARACTWPCTITQMDPKDELTGVYETFVFWADAVIISTAIRWGGASSLYYKMIERLNPIQNQMTIADKVLIRNKVISFIVTGGQDHIQAVVGQMMTFFGELGFLFLQFPFIAHSRGWHAEDMGNNISYIKRSEDLKEGAHALVERSAALAQRLIGKEDPLCAVAKGGRKAR